MTENQPRLPIMRRIKGALMRHMPYMISCAEVEVFIQDYLSGDLPAGIRRRFDFHIRLCRECRDYLAAYQRTMVLEKAVMAPGQEGLEAVPEDLVQAILKARE